ncbi:MFS transporter [Rhizobium sp. BG4]|uniref:MFS transporter n=1 Tax=Rhizobium sp. BG4 TaxID=2613770 RepID=UPI001FF0752A|nr:MFS transporter [Rhizobium sp. BG4]
MAAGLGIGAWGGCLPLLLRTMSLDEAQLGQILFGFASGAIAMVILFGQLIDRFSKTWIGLIGSTAFGLGVSLMPLSETSGQLALVVIFAGAGFGTLDVAMNTRASIIERQANRPMMSSFHAMFSIGNLLGAFLVGQIISHGGTLRVCLGTAGALAMLLPLVAAWSTTALWTQPATMGPSDGAVQTPEAQPKATLIFVYGCLALMFVLAEAGMMDWSGIFVVKYLFATESMGAYAFGILTGAVAIGRLLGDRVVQRIGLMLTIQIGGASCAAAVTAMLAIGSVPAALVALAICGLGMANINPSIFAATGRLGFQATGKAMSVVKAMGYFGLLVGPALLGFLAKNEGLQVSLLLVASAFAAIAALSFLSRK